MADEDEAALRDLVRRQQTVISQQRFEIQRVKHIRLGLVAGQHIEAIDPNLEAERVEEWAGLAGEHFQDMIRALRFYAKAANYEGGLVSLVALDQGARARELLRALGFGDRTAP
jgi:hypothetical protein